MITQKTILTLEKPVALIGMMGAGKTHIGRQLATRLNLPFYDSDKVIEEKAGMTIPDIFKEFGEEKFRTSERTTIKELIGQGASIIATGGGAVTNPQTLALLKEQTQLVWLDAPLDTIWERVKDCTNRPLLQTQNPREKLKELYEARLPLYQQARHHFINDGDAQKLNALIKLLSDAGNEDSL